MIVVYFLEHGYNCRLGEFTNILAQMKKLIDQYQGKPKRMEISLAKCIILLGSIRFNIDNPHLILPHLYGHYYLFYNKQERIDYISNTFFHRLHGRPHVCLTSWPPKINIDGDSLVKKNCKQRFIKTLKMTNRFK